MYSTDFAQNYFWQSVLISVCILHSLLIIQGVAAMWPRASCIRSSLLWHMQLIDGPYSVASLHSLQHVIHGMVPGLTYEFKVSSALALFFFLVALKRQLSTTITICQKIWFFPIIGTLFMERLQLSNLIPWPRLAFCCLWYRNLFERGESLGMRLVIEYNEQNNYAYACCYTTQLRDYKG